MTKAKVSAINYTNTKPFLLGLQQLDELELQLDYPSKIAENLIQNKAQIGIIPLAEYLRNKNQLQIISDYGIACNGEVKTVALLSNLPLPEIQNIVLDYQSRTSVELCKILCKHFWNIQPTFSALKVQDNIEQLESVVIIGDRVFEYENKFKYKYDLGLEWKKFTGLPFVFAVWVTNATFDNAFIEKFNAALSLGINDLNLVFKAFDIEDKVLQNYLLNDIKFNLSLPYQEAIKTFEKFLVEEKILI